RKQAAFLTNRKARCAIAPELVEKVWNEAGEKGADTRIIRCAENEESPCWLAFVAANRGLTK
ncbi:MAG: hypothetical protein ACI4JY_08210, partial [Oscillospiraceae bacterium]